MGLFDKKEEVKEEKEIITVTEIDKLKTYIKKNSGKITDELIRFIVQSYVEGITDYKRCKEFIDLCIKNDNELSKNNSLILEQIYQIYMNFENTNISYNLINMVLKSDIQKMNFLDYMYKSRAYFTDAETWAARVYEVFNEDTDIKEALKEDKMRIGIYPNLLDENIDKMSKKVDSISLKINNMENIIKNSNDKVNTSNKTLNNLLDESISKINSTHTNSIREIQNFTKESLESIKRILNANPSYKKDILTELEKQFNVIEAFDENIPIKERYEKLLSLKDKTIIYHPKFDETLKYVLIGKTVCLSGPNKCGKTNLAKQLSELFNISFNNIGNLHDEITQINGYYDLNTNYNKPVFQQAFENGGIVLMKNIDNAPIEVIHTLNNIISNFKYNPYIFGDKTITTPNKNFRLIMTNNNAIKIDGQDIDNLVTINLDYDTNFENSLTKDKNLIEFLHTLRSKGLNITTDTFIDIIAHLNIGLFTIEDILQNYIISTNPTDLLKRKSEEISSDNKYNNTLKKLLKG